MGFFTAFPLAVYAGNARPEVPASGGYLRALTPPPERGAQSNDLTEIS